MEHVNLNYSFTQIIAIFSEPKTFWTYYVGSFCELHHKGKQGRNNELKPSIVG